MIDQAETVVVLVDSSKFEDPSGHVVCGLDQIDIVVTDEGISARHLAMLEAAGTQVIVARE
jgi:DeoR family ulaG and ulaABCDEF operon transcriptional repressor